MMEGKVNDLITLGIWDVDQARFRGWFSQFNSDEEQFFAACILDTLIYRPKEQFTASLRALINGPIRWELEPILAGDSDLDLQRALAKGSIGGLLVIPAIDETEPPTKSGPFVLRRLKKSLGIHDDMMAWPWTANRLVKGGSISTVIVIDDFIGTGNQVIEYMRRTFTVLDPKVRWLYAAVAANGDGIKHIRQDLPNLKVFTAELFEREHGFFSERYWKAVSNDIITASMAKDFYLDFLDRKGLIEPGNDFDACPLGYGELALCLGFEHGTPDNSLPILWSKDGRWQPLLER